MWNKVVAIDVDGVLAQHDEWKGVDHFGDPIPGAVQFTHSLKSMGFDIIIHTLRCTEGVAGIERGVLLRNRVRDYLDTHGFAYDHIHIEPGKPMASVFIDDNAIRCRPQENPEAFTHTLSMLQELKR